MKYKQIIFNTFFVSLAVTTGLKAQNPKKVTIDLENKRFIGNISNLDRTRYFNMHESYFSNEFNSNNISKEILDNLDVGRARAASGPGRKTIRKNGKVSSYPNASVGKTGGQSIRNAWMNRVGIAEFNKRKTSDVILVDAPKEIFLPNGDYKKAAKFAENYIKSAFNGVIPKYYEIMNEPFVHARDFGKNTSQVVAQMSELHKAMADHLHKVLPETLVGGYSSAFPQMEAGNPMFRHWNVNQKKFMDITNNSMDFYATHIYDGANIVGSDQRRQGSNMEAILDLIEAYSQDKFGEVKPHLISEFGRTERPWIRNSQGVVSPYTESRDGEIIQSINAMLMQLFEKPDRLLKAVPFIVSKSNWFYDVNNNPNNHPYPWALLPRLKNGNYTYTHLRKFYELWKDVTGHRVIAETNDPDILAQVFVDKSKAYVAIHNMDGANRSIQLDFLQNTNVSSVTTRSFFTDNNGIPKLNITKANSLPNKISVRKDGTTLLVLNLNKAPNSKYTTRENVYYPTRNKNKSNVLRTIKANEEYTYRFDNILTDNGKGISKLRVSFGRENKASKKPKVVINGTLIETPQDWKGDDQKERDRWFGMVEIPFKSALLTKNKNTIKVSFPDGGGNISSVVLIGQRSTKKGKVAAPSNASPVAKVPTPAVSKNNLIIEAENFAKTTGTYNDTPTGGAGFGVNKTKNGINYVNAGDAATYRLSVADAGVYEITYVIASPSNNAQIKLFLNNRLVTTDNVKNNGSWSKFVTLKSKANINLTKGNHEIKVLASGTNLWQWNLDKIILKKVGELSNVSKTVNLAPIHDAYLQGGTRYNTASLRTESNRRITYLKFDLRKVKGNIKNGNLELTVHGDTGNGVIDVYQGTDKGWMENDLSNTNVPNNIKKVGSVKGNFGIGKKVNIKLSGINKKDYVTFILRQNSGNDVSFASKENTLANGPKLKLTYTTGTTGNKSIIEGEDATNALVVYPNPVTDNLFLLGNHLGKEIKIVDFYGKVVTQIDAYENTPINVSNLSQGSYIICVYDLNNSKMFKSEVFVKE
ncbi:carbohydrate-binding protein [Aquimarina agarilytica]|uniref:carbohydrate-binding protein n=1 Tax=Aquimarina agarilytica TaxID=1087449 RepID=UPI00028992B5|nr:carbohydrate-binding protein [Aquimarina agarilytica]